MRPSAPVAPGAAPRHTDTMTDAAPPLLALFSPAAALIAAAAAVGLPVLIHLLFRKRYQVVPWAAIRFLLVAERKHRRRIDQWLLLALRMLCLLLPLVAMAAATKWAEDWWQAIRPGVPETVSTASRTHHVLVLDGSLSMTAITRGGKTRFDHAIARAEKLIREANPGDGFTLLFLDSTAQVVVPGPALEPEEVLPELRKLRATHAATDPLAALNLTTVADIVTRSPKAFPRKQVTFLTDLQGAFWPKALHPPEPSTEPDATPAGMPAAWGRILCKADVVVLDATRLDAEEDPVNNAAIVDLALADPVPLAGASAEITATVANYGRAGWLEVEVTVLRPRPDGTAAIVPTLPLRSRRVDIPAGGRVPVTFSLDGYHGFQSRGPHIVQARLVPPPDAARLAKEDREKVLVPDRLAADDVRSLAVEVQDGLRVILVDGKPDIHPLQRGTGYLNFAFSPQGARPADTPARPQVMSPAQFAAAAPAELVGVDAVFLCDVPTVTEPMVARLEAILRRGGGVVIGLGPNAADPENRREYNRLLFNGGKGLLPRPIGDVVAAGPDDPGFRFHPDDGEAAFRRPPLAEFRAENDRAGLITVPFKRYVRLLQSNEEPRLDGGAHRLLSFVRTAAPPAGTEKVRADPAVLDWPRFRGRVVVYTGTFALDEDWTDWPKRPSYLPFAQELLRFVTANPDRHTVKVGESLEEFFPPIQAGQAADVTIQPAGDKPDAEPQPVGSVPVKLEDEIGVARFPNTLLSGIYRMGVGGARDHVFAVNIPEGSGTTESDLRRPDPSALRSTGPVQVLTDPADVKPGGNAAGLSITTPRPHGPTIARWIMLAALIVLVAELFVAWRTGPARAPGAGSAAGSARAIERRRGLRLLGTTVALVPLAAALFLLFTVVHADWFGNLLGFLPEQTRRDAEAEAGAPSPEPGESTKWRLDRAAVFLGTWADDARLRIGLVAGCIVLTVVAYRLERRAVAGGWRLVLPGLFRAASFGVALLVLLPQRRVEFDRESWPDVVLLIDTSASMSTIDDLKDPAVRARAQELLREANLSEANRLKLIQLLLTRKNADWLDKLLKEKKARVHIYEVDKTTKAVDPVMNAVADGDKGRAALLNLRPVGDESRLGDGITHVRKAFRGSMPAAIIMFTDGVNTAGDDLLKAAREAHAAGARVFLVGAGDARVNPDLGLSDLQTEEVVTRGDKLVIAARLTARGAVPAEVPVILYEKVGGKLVERARVPVVPNPIGETRDFQIGYTPTEIGERGLVLEVPPAPGETDPSNNRIEWTVTVTEARRARVLYVEGRPRYDFRFVKVLLERESEKVAGNKSIELKVVLLGAGAGWSETDKSALTAFPIRKELFEYDAVILGDIDPEQLPQKERNLQDLADFVRIRGGGLMFLVGEQSGPAAFAGTPLAGIMPVVVSGVPPKPTPEDQPLTEGYQPKLTTAGAAHPLFRFHPDSARSAQIWQGLRPLYWYARGYRRKPAAEVLAVHPGRPAEGAVGTTAERHPLVLQQFVGAGRVVFLGFDDTWRWRWRNDEEHFNRFWLQAVRLLARTRVGRVRVQLDRQAPYREGDRIVVMARFPDDAPPPAPGTAVRVMLQRSPLPGPDGTPGKGEAETEILTLGPPPVLAGTDPDAPARADRARTFQAVVTRTPVGAYRFTLVEPSGAAPRPWAEGRVLPPLRERDRVDMDHAALTAAAGVWKRPRPDGTEEPQPFYTLANAEQVFDELKDLHGKPLPEAAPPYTVWDQPLTYVLVALLFVTEWLLRKRERLL